MDPEGETGRRAAAAGSPHERREGQVERLLIVLMGARLALAMASLGIGLGLEALGGYVTVSEWRGFYLTVALCFVATLVYRPFVGRIRRPAMFAAANVVTDLALVTALVVFSGGKHSVFTFLYVIVALYGAVLFPGRGALLCASSASLAYAGVLVLGQRGWLGPGVELAPSAVVFTSWLVQASALAAAAGLASFLARELERAGRALDQRTHDLAQLRTLHQRTVESLMSGLLTADLEGRVTSFNAEGERITGLGRDDAMGRTLESVLPGIGALMGGAGEGDLRFRSRMDFSGPAGEKLHLGIGAYELRDTSGESCGTVVIFQDVTGVVVMERELRRSERLAAIGTLSASIAHEVRNPLAAISGSIEMMRGKLPPDEAESESARLMDIAVREVDRLDRLIADFLQYARPGELQLQNVLVPDLVSEVIEMFEGVRSPTTKLRTDVDCGLRVVADPAQLRQVVWNLVLNAAQAMPDGGELLVSGRVVAPEAPQGVRSKDRLESQAKAVWAEIKVMDQGVGIPAEMVERIFDPFFTTKTGGTGLGLATVHRVIEDHGGSIRVERGREPWRTGFCIRVRLAESSG